MALAPSATVHAPLGMVCSPDHLASSAGVALLRAGGSAADAAVGASAVLSVTTPHMCGMGGDLFALVHAPEAPGDEEPVSGARTHPGAGPAAAVPGATTPPPSVPLGPAALNASGRAGSGADPERLRSEGYPAMPLRGDVRSVPVPGCVDGWVALHRRFGRLPLADVLASACYYAESGFPVSPLLAAAVPLVADVAGAEELTVGRPRLQAGQLLRRPGVARTLSAIVAKGRAGFYEGDFGTGLLALGGGEYVADDLRRPQAEWVEPLRASAWGHDLWTVPPNSQGYVALSAAWIAQGLDLPADPDDPAWAHLLIEATRQASWDRPAVLHEDADGPALLSSARLGPRRSAIHAKRASSVATRNLEGDTIALVAVDRQGMGICLIQSNATGFGAHLAVPGTGVFLHNRGLGFSLTPGHPAEYGPGRRPPHTLSPLLVTDPEGRLHSVVGTMGADAQPQVLLQILARVLVAGQSPAPAVAAARWTLSGGDSSGFTTWDDPTSARVSLEGHAPSEWASGLRARGHAVDVVEPFSSAAGHAQLIVADGDTLAGASDPRALTGAAVGY